MANALEIDVKIEELTQARRFEIIRISARVTFFYRSCGLQWFFFAAIKLLYSRGNHDMCIATCRCLFEYALSSLGAIALGWVYLDCGHDRDFTRK